MKGASNTFLFIILFQVNLNVCILILSALSISLRNSLALLSLLDVQMDVQLDSTMSSAVENLEKMTELEFLQLAPLNSCYYAHGIYGHIMLFTHKSSECSRRLNVTVRAQSNRQLNWFICSLRSALPDDTTLIEVVKSAENCSANRLQHQIASVLAMLGKCEHGDQSMMETTGHPAGNSLFDKIRHQFVEKQLGLLETTRIKHIPLSAKSYHDWQQEMSRFW